MPSKTSFALLALLAASVSALPTRGNSYTDLFARGPDTPASGAVDATAGGASNAAVQPPAVGPSAVGSGPPTPVAAASGSGTGSHPHHPHQHSLQHPHNAHGHLPGHLPHHHSGNANGLTHRPHPVHRHTHNGELGQMSASGNVRNPGSHRRRLSHDLSSASVTPSSGSGATVVPPTSGTPQGLSRREFYENPDLEARGLLETLGLKARVATLTVKQTEKMSKAKTICGGLASKKDQHTCHKTVDKIIQLTKERNYDVEQFIKTTNHHDVFTTSDPSLKSSSSSSS